MLLMQAQENEVALDEEQLLFITGGQDNAIDEDVDEQPAQDLALNMDNVFQADDCDAFDFDVNEAPTARTMFMANLSSTYPVYDEAGPSYDLDILSKVHDHDHYQDAICEHYDVHEMHDNVQPNYVVDSHTDYTSDSNMISYDQYVKDNAVPVVQSNVSDVPNDAYMMILNDMHEPPSQHIPVTSQNNIADKLLTAKLATYKEQVELYERRAIFELMKREQKIDEQLRIVITDPKAYSIGPSEKNEYARTLPLYNKCKFYHNGTCTLKCANYNWVGHLILDCRSPAATTIMVYLPRNPSIIYNDLYEDYLKLKKEFIVLIGCPLFGIFPSMQDQNSEDDVIKTRPSVVLSGTFSIGDVVLLCGWDLAIDGASVTSFSMLFSIPNTNYVKLIGFTNNDAPIVEVVKLGKENMFEYLRLLWSCFGGKPCCQKGNWYSGGQLERRNSFMRMVNEDFQFTPLNSNLQLLFLSPIVTSEGYQKILGDDGFLTKTYVSASFDLINHHFQVFKTPQPLRDVLASAFHISQTRPSIVLLGTFSVGDIILLCGWDLAVDGASVTSFSMIFCISTTNSVKLIGFTNNDAPIVEVDKLEYQLAHTLQVYDHVSEEF
uniref:Reverse transcriptase domain-containing protein n=1 Tax=Tanacetum cinerariifolium TaxID=118510 RepID=A0A6L2JFH8_TANCI|nr:hypothetical protein [Tanacetum cinerariifolium]